MRKEMIIAPCLMLFVARAFLFVACATISQVVSAQSPPPVRPIGRLLAASAESLASVSQVRALPNGRVIVNDNAGRRLLMLDSTLQHATVIADTTAATSRAYGMYLGGLIAYRGDSTLFVSPQEISMLVIDPAGHIVRTIAAPPKSLAYDMIGGPYGTPGFDAKGRLIFRGNAIRYPVNPATGVRPPPDSAFIERFDFTSRAIDTVAKVLTPVLRLTTGSMTINGRTMGYVLNVVDPIPWTDDWAVLADGTVAVVHGRDYRVDFTGGDGKQTSGPKVPFAWQRLTDEDKTAILDSAGAAVQAEHDAAEKRDSVRKAQAGSPAPLQHNFPKAELVAVNEMPDYRPAFRQGAARGDADGRLWIRTSKMSNGGPVYDVIDRQGVLIDRVELPPGRIIAGFGPGGVVYMGVLDGSVARLERALMH